MTSKPYKIFALLLIFIALTVYGYIRVTHFFDIDACLDKGGRWNYEKKECEYCSFDPKILEDVRFASGQEFGTHKPIIPKIFQFDCYTFVAGYPNDSGSASIGLYYEGKELLYETSSDGFYDTIMLANLNNDGIPDFLISFTYEDGASLSGLISNSKVNFKPRKLFDEWTETYCIESRDTLMRVQPLQIMDINGDGKDDLIANLVKINGSLFSISCTDTVLAD